MLASLPRTVLVMRVPHLRCQPNCNFQLTLARLLQAGKFVRCLATE